MVGKKKELGEKDLHKFVQKIQSLPVNDRLQGHIKWIYKLFTKKRQHLNRNQIKERILQIADDIRLWELHEALKNALETRHEEGLNIEAVEYLSRLATQIFNRYETKPPSAVKKEEEETITGGVVELPLKLDKNAEAEKAVGVTQTDDMEAFTWQRQ